MITDQNIDNQDSSQEQGSTGEYGYKKEYSAYREPSNYGQTSNTSTSFNMEEMPDNYMTLSVVSTVVGWLTCCCSCGVSGILGAIAIIFSSQVSTKFMCGDVYGASSSSKTAKILGIISLVISGLTFFAWLARVAYNVITGSLDEALDSYMMMLDEI